MREVGIYDAKTHFSRLIDDVEGGESVIITRHGKPVARLMPVDVAKMTVDEAIEAIHAFGRDHARGDLDIRELIEEGRRF